jgi:hypothetical protein
MGNMSGFRVRLRVRDMVRVRVTDRIKDMVRDKGILTLTLTCYKFKDPRGQIHTSQ